MHHHQQPTLPPPFAPNASATTNLPKDHTRITLYIILATSFFSLLFIISIPSPSSSTSSQSFIKIRPDPVLFPDRPISPTELPSGPAPPSIAYLISGSAGDSARILRLLFASYHPRNHYLLHLDLSAPQTERDRLAVTVQSVPIFKAAQNVDVIGKADYAYPRGSSTISSTLHGASVLLRLASNWDWFISLNAGDYPLVTQDDLLHILSYLPKDLNFVNHTGYIGWKESKRLKPIIVDTGLYLLEKHEIFYASQKRELPNAFRLFSGSSFTMLTRSFMEFCILGTDNLPRTLLMYFANTPYSFTNYFPTVLCNSDQFKRTVINHNLQYIAFNKSSTKKPPQMNSADFDAMIQSGAAFATQFRFDDPVLDRIDQEILKRSPGKAVPGGWCLGEPDNGTCSVWGDADILRPGPGARRLEKRIVESLSDGRFQSQQCQEE
ncbi:Core-2/I-branching beta-1,6-N-acetylglucosaminyltransferase family protein, putative [Theobroma cacao]|uniref:Core-2/I-branching beta-1,6-N-acetylglucosaminyltransferase family protein, putative n=1 Tax=Theobroma cacao TaxID=3641 RepID=A0A061EK45_THECC|nr:Core-2/I-branching beta-1,6-N-acetylglucosaminyltransferase family protein, putative [Theobroma cacao]